MRPYQRTSTSLPRDILAQFNEQISKGINRTSFATYHHEIKATKRNVRRESFDDKIGTYNIPHTIFLEFSNRLLCRTIKYNAEPELHEMYQQKINELTQQVQQLEQNKDVIVLKDNLVKKYSKGTDEQMTAQILAQAMPINQLNKAIDTLYGGTDMQRQLKEVMAIAQRGKTVDSAMQSTIVILVKS